MQKQSLRIVILLMVFSLLTSCATVPNGGQTATPQDDQTATQQTDQTATPQDDQTATQQTDQTATQQTAPNSAERAILSQAVATGAVVGGVVGAGAGALAGKLIGNVPGIGGLIGGIVGAIAGGVVGKVVGQKQVENYRDITLSNDQFEKLLASAQDYNCNVANYNNNLRQEITQIKSKTKPEQEKIAKEKLKGAEDQRLKLTQAIDERQKLSQTLVQPQMVQYQETLADLNKQGQDMDGIIKELHSISEPAKIGELRPITPVKIMLSATSDKRLVSLT